MFGMLLAVVTTTPPATLPPKPATVSVRVLKATRVSEEIWKAEPRRVERVVRDQDGREVRLRLIEFE
jgi:hypothetical protein